MEIAKFASTFQYPTWHNDQKRLLVPKCKIVIQENLKRKFTKSDYEESRKR